MAHSGEIDKLERRWMENPTGLTFAPLAEAYRRAGDQPRALEVLELGLAQHPAYVPALIVRARCHLDARLDGEAETSFHAVLSSDPHNVIALKGLADLYELTERLPGALGFLNRLLEADPTHGAAATQRDRIGGLIAERHAAHGVSTRSGGGADPSPPDGAAGTVAVADEIPVEPELTEPPDAVVVGEIERSAEFDAFPIAVPLPDPVPSLIEPPEVASVATEEVHHPLDGFDASAWNLPFDERELPAQAFDENLGLDSLEPGSTADAPLIAPEAEAPREGESLHPGSAPDSGGEEPPSTPRISVEEADLVPEERNPAMWGGAAGWSAQPAPAPGDDPSQHPIDLATPMRSAIEPEAAVEALTSSLPAAADPGPDTAPTIADTDAALQELGGEQESVGVVEAINDEAPVIGEVNPPIMAESVPESAFYFGAVHGAVSLPEAPPEPVSEGGEVPLQLADDTGFTSAEGEGPVPGPAEVTSLDVRLEGESYLPVENGWLSSTDWSSPEAEVAPTVPKTDQAALSVGAELVDQVSPEHELEGQAAAWVAGIPEQAPEAIAPVGEDSLEAGFVLATGEAESIVEASGGQMEAEPVVETAGEPGGGFASDLVRVETVTAEAPGVEAEAVTVVEGAFEEEPETPEPAPEIEPELVITETMAEVFLRQGHRPLALAVYAQLLEREPGNSRLQEAISRLRGELLGGRVGAPVSAVDVGTGPEEPVGSFLARVLGPEPVEEPPPDMVAAVADPLGGRPTQPAADPSLRLSTIFGEDARRRSVAVSGLEEAGPESEPSFDEFFGAAGVPAGAGGDEAELEQFNAWLRSLQR